MESTDIMTEYCCGDTKSLDFLWMSCRDAHMLTASSLPEESHPKHSHIVRLGNN